MSLNPNITPELESELNRRLSEINPNLKKKTFLSETAYKRWWNRYVQVFTELDTEDIHYEYYQGHACLHLEGRSEPRKHSRVRSNGWLRNRIASTASWPIRLTERRT